MGDSPTQDENLKIEPDQQQPEMSSDSEMDTENDAEELSDSEASEKELSTFDLVKSAIEDGENDDTTEGNSEEDEPEEAKDEVDETEDEADEDNLDDEPSEDELKTWKAKTRKRFEQLQTRLRDSNERLEKAEADAGLYKQFTGFLDTNGITQEEANQLFDIGAMMKNDPFRALEALRPHYENLLKMTGNVLPADLQQQVDQGYISQQHAVELSQARARQTTGQVVRQNQQQRQQTQNVQRQQEMVQQMQNALGAWERGWSASDPDYEVKKDRVSERIELMMVRAQRDGKLPQTEQEAVALAEDARKAVDAEFLKIRPRKPVSTVAGGVSKTAKPEPKNTVDVINRVLG